PERGPGGLDPDHLQACRVVGYRASSRGGGLTVHRGGIGAGPGVGVARGVAETARRSIVALERALSGPRVGRSGVEVVQAVNVARGGVGVGGAPPGSARLGEAVRDSLGVAP